jgi:hypothetical protein
MPHKQRVSRPLTLKHTAWPTTIVNVCEQSLRAREAEAMCNHVWIFEVRTLSTASPATMRDVRPMAGQIRRNPPGLPRVPRLGSRRRKLLDLESRGVSQRGAIQIHPFDQIGV